MMVPAFRSFIPGRMLLMVRNVAVRLPSRDTQTLPQALHERPI